MIIKAKIFYGNKIQNYQYSEKGKYIIIFQQHKKNKQNNQSNTEQSKPKGSQQNQSKKNQIKELVKSFNKILNGNQKSKGNSFTGQQNHNSSTKQWATTDQNPYIYIKQCEMNNCFDRKQQNKNNDAYKKNWKKHSWNQADVVQKLTKVLQKTLKQQGNYFDRNNNKFNNNQGKLFNSLNEYSTHTMMLNLNAMMTHSCTSKYQQARPTTASKTKEETSRLEVISKETSTKYSYEELGSCPIDQIIAI
ncbi:Hypothetical_protein [Hexamita inflata]|uniref:Hypothetical_protein n=1 Tax=Hexamita inflata TaxID=28002 RepID=A0AA86UW91_9EUKA|nr:Hypothetical protein HINF_LOCUS62010 [Hexamita inflata]